MAWEDQLTAADLDPDAAVADLALRRHTDRCFFAVEEVVPHPGGGVRGFIVEGHLIDADDVAELRRGGSGASPAACRPTRPPPSLPPPQDYDAQTRR